MYRTTDTMETKEFIILVSKPPGRRVVVQPASGVLTLSKSNGTHGTAVCLEIGIQEQALVNLSLKMPPPIIVQPLISQLVFMVELELFFVNDLSEWNGYGIPFGQDIPVQDHTISACQS